MTSEKLQVKRGDLHMTVKMAFNRFLRAELSAQEKKRTCQREGSGVLNHWSLRILKHLPEWEPKLLLEDFNFPEWGKNYRILLCGAKIHLDLIFMCTIKWPSTSSWWFQSGHQEKNGEDSRKHLQFGHVVTVLDTQLAAASVKPIWTLVLVLRGQKKHLKPIPKCCCSHNLSNVIFVIICIQGCMESQQCV